MVFAPKPMQAANEAGPRRNAGPEKHLSFGTPTFEANAKITFNGFMGEGFMEPGI